jgi:hypothetical protein
MVFLVTLAVPELLGGLVDLVLLLCIVRHRLDSWASPYALYVG